MSVTYYAPGVETYDIEGIVDGDYTSDGYMVSATSSPIIPLLEDPFIPVIGQKEVGTSGVYVNVRQFATFDLIWLRYWQYISRFQSNSWHDYIAHAQYNCALLVFL